MVKYKYANEERSKVNDIESGIFGIHPGIHLWSDVQKWLNEGGVVEPFLTEQEQTALAEKQTHEERIRADIQSVRDDDKIKELREMTPTQVGNWIEANLTNLATAKDVIKTLAVAVCVLVRRI